MKTYKEIKEQAMKIYQDNMSGIFKMFLPVFMLSLFTGVLLNINPGVISIGIIALEFISVLLYMGMTREFVRYYNGEKVEFGFSSSLHYFKHQNVNCVSLIWHIMLFTLLWLFVPFYGIVHIMGYSLVQILFIQNENKRPQEYIKESLALMKGHKLRLFFFTFSFFLWFLLIIFTFGFAVFFVSPYMFIAHNLFLLNILEKQK